MLQEHKLELYSRVTIYVFYAGFSLEEGQESALVLQAWENGRSEQLRFHSSFVCCITKGQVRSCLQIPMESSQRGPLFIQGPAYRG